MTHKLIDANQILKDIEIFDKKLKSQIKDMLRRTALAIVAKASETMPNSIAEKHELVKSLDVVEDNVDLKVLVESRDGKAAQLEFGSSKMPATGFLSRSVHSIGFSKFYK